jgi:hypothetical protein
MQGKAAQGTGRQTVLRQVVPLKFSDRSARKLGNPDHQMVLINFTAIRVTMKRI